MATTAKQSSSTVRSSSAAAAATAGGNFPEDQEDIATIAKQISDHAEAIYQTWKARGLAPTEILNCHTGTSDAFGKTLTPTLQQRNSKESPVAELLAQAPDMSNNNLEKLVNSFVSEDKARIAAARKSGSPNRTINLGSGIGSVGGGSVGGGIGGGSTIKQTLQKFENNKEVTNVRPKFLRNSSPQPNSANTLNKNVPDVLMNTIEQQQQQQQQQKQQKNQQQPTLVKEISPQKPQAPAKPASLINHVPTWPLKNRIGAGTGTNKSILKNDDDSPSMVKKELDKKTADLMDEVSREEERLINALKTGTVLNNEKSLPEVITSTLNDNISSSSPSSSSSSSSVDATKPDVSTTNSSNSLPKPWSINSTTKPIIPPTGTTIHSHIIINKDKEDTPLSNNVPTTNKVIKSRILRTTEAAMAIPHPEQQQTTKTGKEKGSGINPIRPFLTRGSVAERVLIFERCPEIKAPPRNVVKEPSKLQVKTAAAKPLLSHTTLQRHIKGSAKNVYIPRFHFPSGKPLPQIAVETTMQRIQSAVHQFPNSQIHKDDFHSIVQICGMPLYWRAPLFNCTPHTASGCVDGYKFVDFWKHMALSCHDAASRFVYILSKGNRNQPYILPEDLVPLVQDVVDTHPGLVFLKEATEFHSRYVHTVIARIFYTVNKSWSGKINCAELKRSNLLQVIQLLEEEEDINQITAYFSYEHFYVIYCKFWELDRDHDLLIDQNDLARHNDHTLSLRMIERIFSGCVTRGGIENRHIGPNGPQITYTDFVWFILSEEDKTNPKAIEYWFRCMDLDGDGVLSMYELEYFYEEQQQRMESIGIETLPFEDCICQMLDMIKPEKPGCITLKDLKRCKMAPIFFDTFFNLEKYLEHEQRDPFATQRDNDDMSDWDRFAAQEYELLVAEEGVESQGSYDDEDLDYYPEPERPVDDVVNSHFNRVLIKWMES